MTYARISSLSALPISAGITFGLFLIMTLLVAGDGIVTIDPREIKPIIIYDEVIVDPPLRAEPEVPKPLETIPEPPVPIPTFDRDTSGTPGIPVPTPKFDTPSGPTGWDILTDGEYLPIVRVAPQYPRRAQERGIEGYAIVELTVGADGSVPSESVKVIEAEPNGFFESAAIKAAQKFKYKPKVVNGKSQQVTGVTYRFSFTLAN